MSRLQRPVRALHDEEMGEVSPSESETSLRSASPEPSSDSEMDGDEEGPDEDKISEKDNDVQEDLNTNIKTSLRNISFGALASAQDTIPSRRSAQHSSVTASSRTDASKVNDLRARLAELKALKEKSAQSSGDTEDASRKTSEHTSRSSKHAPTELSSKRAVTRKRTVVADLSNNPTHARDPRFAATITPVEQEKLKRTYNFLDTYKASELSTLKTAMSELKARTKKRKSRALTGDEEAEKESLQRAINVMENRAKTEAARERELEVQRIHKRAEKEMVKQGKKPFFLKRSEVKTRALTEQWEGMKGREKDKALKRRRKKISERERRAMPDDRRQRVG